MKLSVIASLILLSVQSGQQEQCSVERLPVFGDVDYARRSPDCDRFQAIVPAYRFQCSGRVTEWGACVQPGGRSGEEYYIQFQVWRPTGGTEGCYELVGYNETPPDDVDEESDGDSKNNITDGTLSPVDSCVVLTVRENEQIDFQPGDVIGFYVDYFRSTDHRNYDSESTTYDRSDDTDDGSYDSYDRRNTTPDRNDGGIQWIEDNEVVVYYRENLPREDIRSQYALNGPNPTECGFQISDENRTLHMLHGSSSGAPIISLSLATVIPLPWQSPLPSSLGQVVVELTPTLTTSLTPSPSTTSLVTTLTSVPLPPSPSGPVFTHTTPSLTHSPSATTNSCSTAPSYVTVNVCQDVPSNNTSRNIPIIAAAVSILIIVIATIAVFLWLRRKRKRDPEVVNNVAYSGIRLEFNPSYDGVSVPSAVMDTNVESYGVIPIYPNTAYHLNPSYHGVSVPNAVMDTNAELYRVIPIYPNTAYHFNPSYHRVPNAVMDTNAEPYAASSIPISPNTAYHQTVQPPSRTSVDISTSANEAYVSTDIPTSVNAAYQPIQGSNDLVYDYVITDNKSRV